MIQFYTDKIFPRIDDDNLCCWGNVALTVNNAFIAPGAMQLRLIALPECCRHSSVVPMPISRIFTVSAKRFLRDQSSRVFCP